MADAKRLSIKGYMDLFLHEGIVLSTYIDSVGVETIFVGHTAKAGPPDPSAVWGKTFTLDDALETLIRDVPNYEALVHKFIKVPLEQHEFDAWFLFLYNTGGINRKTRKPYTCIPKFNAGQKQRAYDALLTVNNGGELTKRRTQERDLMRDGRYSNTSEKANLYPADSSGRVLWSKGRRVSVREPLTRALQIAEPNRNTVPAPAKPKPRPPVDRYPPKEKRGGFWASVGSFFLSLFGRQRT